MAGSSQGRRDEVEGSTTQLRRELTKKVRGGDAQAIAALLSPRNEEDWTALEPAF